MKSKIVIAILVLIIIGLGVYFIINHNNKSNQNVVNELNENNNIAVNNINANDTKKDNTKTNTMKESEALEIGEEKYIEAQELYLGGVEFDETTNIEEEGIIYSKVTNSDKIKKVFSKNGLVQYLAKNEFVKKFNGEYYRINADRGGDMYYIDNQLKVVSIDENKIVFNSIERYFDESTDFSTLNDNSEDIKTNDIINSFILVKEEGVWKVEEYTLPL